MVDHEEETKYDEQEFKIGLFEVCRCSNFRNTQVQKPSHGSEIVCTRVLSRLVRTMEMDSM